VIIEKLIVNQSLPSLESEGSLTYSQEPAIGHYPEPEKYKFI
jgi:hypothetical protein